MSMAPGSIALAVMGPMGAAALIIQGRSWMFWRKLHPGEPSLPLNRGIVSMLVSLTVLLAVSADLALEQGRSSPVIAGMSLLTLLAVRFVFYRRQGH
jgi:hypothetical protein